jgi:hypothetical protein
MSPLWRRWLWIALAAVLGVLLTLAVGTRLAAQQLQARVVAALGPRATVGAVEVGWTGVELRDLRVGAAGTARWPASDELRAARVHVRPDLRSLWSGVTGGAWRIARVVIDDGYLSMLRTRDGRLRVLPSAFEAAGGSRAEARGQAAPAAPAAAGAVIADLVLRGATIDFHDASVRTSAPHRLRVERLDASFGPLALPGGDAEADLDLRATLDGVQRDGRITIRGRLNPATRDARLHAELQGVDLVALQPYLLKVSEGGVRSGRLDLRLDASVQRQQLRAPGVVVLTGVELAAGDGLLGTFAGVPRQAVIAAMSRDGRIEVKFTLEGRLDDPSFSLNENLATRLATGLAESLGVSVRGVVEGVGGVIRGLLGR